MKKFFLIIGLTIPLSQLQAFETRDHVMKLQKVGQAYHVSFGTLATVYSVPLRDQSIHCLEKSITEKKEVRLELDLKASKVLRCSHL